MQIFFLGILVMFTAIFAYDRLDRAGTDVAGETALAALVAGRHDVSMATFFRPHCLSSIVPEPNPCLLIDNLPDPHTNLTTGLPTYGSPSSRKYEAVSSGGSSKNDVHSVLHDGHLLTFPTVNTAGRWRSTNMSLASARLVNYVDNRSIQIESLPGTYEQSTGRVLILSKYLAKYTNGVTRYGDFIFDRTKDVTSFLDVGLNPGGFSIPDGAPVMVSPQQAP